MALYKFEGKVPQIHPRAFIHESAQIIGDVVIGERCFVGAGAIVRGDYGRIRIGDHVAVEEGCIIHAPIDETCDIGSNILLGHGTLIHCARIGSNVRLGIGATLALWSVIEDWVIIADGAVVPTRKTMESGWVYMGNPAKRARPLTEDERNLTLRGTSLYADLCDRYHAGLERID